MIEDNELNSTKNNYSKNVTSSSEGAICISRLDLNLNNFLNCESAPDAPDSVSNSTTFPVGTNSIISIPSSGFCPRRCCCCRCCCCCCGCCCCCCCCCIALAISALSGAGSICAENLDLISVILLLTSELFLSKSTFKCVDQGDGFKLKQLNSSSCKGNMHNWFACMQNVNKQLVTASM